MADISQALEDIQIDFLEMSVYEAAQLTEDQMRNAVDAVYKKTMTELSPEELENQLNLISQQITNALDDVASYYRVVEGQVRDAERSGDARELRESERLLAEVEEFLQSNTLSDMNTEVVIPEFTTKIGTIIESAEDETFMYDTTDADIIYGGETIRYTLTNTAPEPVVEDDSNMADPLDNGELIDINGDGIADIQDYYYEEDVLYDLSEQDFFLNLNDGDTVQSLVWDEDTNVLSLEIETVDREITDALGNPIQLTAKTFMLELEIPDPKGVRLFFYGENYANSSIFNELPEEVANIIFDNDNTDPVGKGMFEEDYTLNEQLQFVDGYEQAIAEISGSVSTMRAAFEESEHDFNLPSNAESVLQELFDAAFNNQNMNSLSLYDVQAATDNFYEILDRYSGGEKAALTMTFIHAFHTADPVQFATMFRTETTTLQGFINYYADQDGLNPSFIEKAMHTILELDMGMGMYGGTTGILHSGLAFATNDGVEGEWTAHLENQRALEFVQDNGFADDVYVQAALNYEVDLDSGAVSADEALGIQQALSALLSYGSVDVKFWKGSSLSKKEWDQGINYLKNNLINSKGELVKNPLKVFKQCINKFFTKNNGKHNVAADNFTSALLFGMSLLEGTALHSALMKGPHGKDIARYLWNISDNDGDDPPYLDQARKYKKKIL